MKILIVDDEKIILEKLKMYISQIFTEKENIFTSDNAAKALEIISSQQPDIILTDIRIQEKTACIFLLSCIIIFQIRS